MGKAALSGQLHTITPIILAGGYGRRLWPLSTRKRPKQFIPFLNGRSLFEATLMRVANKDLFNPAIIVANQEHVEFMQDLGDKTLILEDEPRSTAPAIGNAINQDGVYLVLPCDHIIEDIDQFHIDIRDALKHALDGRIVAFGIKPSYAYTGFGYIRKSDAQFHEKPDQTTAQRYLESGDYFWNAGIFLFRGDVMLGSGLIKSTI